MVRAPSTGERTSTEMVIPGVLTGGSGAPSRARASTAATATRPFTTDPFRTSQQVWQQGGDRVDGRPAERDQDRHPDHPGLPAANAVPDPDRAERGGDQQQA